METLKFNIKKTVVGLFFASMVGLCSCSKEGFYENMGIKTTEIVKFENYDKYKNELSKVLSMDLEERREYEENVGFISLGRECDEFYQNIDISEFNTVEEIKTYVEKNNEYIQIIENGGELYIETLLYNSPNRYFIGEDRIFQIGDVLYKEYSDGTIKSDKQNKEDLLKLKGNSIYEISVDTERFSIIERHLKVNDISIGTKDDAHNCGISVESSNILKNECTNLEMALTVESFSNNGIFFRRWNNEMTVSAYQRTLGIWFSCRRTISFELNVAVDAGDSRTYISSNEAGFFGRKLSHVFEKIDTVAIVDPGAFIVHYGGYDCYADTPTTNPVIIECNSYLF